MARLTERRDPVPERPVLAVAGENIIDLVPTDQDHGDYRALPGGGPANIAIAARRLGSPTALLARIGADPFGALIRARLAADGIAEDYLVDAAEPSSLAVVDFDAAQAASYTFWLAGTADWQWRAGELPAPLADGVRGLHVGSIALHRAPGAAELAALARAEYARGVVTVSLDPNIRPAVIGDLAAARHRIDALLPSCHVVKASDEDLAHLYPGEPVESAAGRILARGPALVVVTRGAAGGLAVTGRRRVAVAAPPIEVVDTVGAGDTFMGALLHALDTRGLLGGDRAAALDGLAADALTELVGIATAAAALNCRRAGADPPTAGELRAFRDR